MAGDDSEQQVTMAGYGRPILPAAPVGAGDGGHLSRDMVVTMEGRHLEAM
jgi:hypothetical protein